MDSKHPVSVLQELMAQQHKLLPAYEMADLSTRSCPRFRCTVKVDGIEVFAEALQKQAAKKQAATDALLRLGYTNSSNAAILSKNKHDILTSTVNYNAIGYLNEYTSKNGLPYPTYNECGCNTIGEFTISCSLGSRLTVGAAPTKKAAKQLAAHYMLKSLENQALITLPTPPPSVSKVDVISDSIIIDKFKKLSVRPLRTTPKISELETEECEHEQCDGNSSVSLEHITPSNSKRIAVESSASLIEKLSRYNLSYSIDVITRNPFVLSLKFASDSNTTIMVTGDTYQEAETNLFRKALKVINTLSESA